MLYNEENIRNNKLDSDVKFIRTTLKIEVCVFIFVLILSLTMRYL